MSARRVRRAPSWQRAPDGLAEHRDWLSLVDVSGPFLALPVLLRTWPTLDALDADMRERLREAHGEWLADPRARAPAWIAFVLRELLGWGEDLCTDTDRLEALGLDLPEHDARVTPTFALCDPSADAADTLPWRLFGLEYDAEVPPTTRLPGSAWAANPCERLALLCRSRDVPLGLATNGRWWGLVCARSGGATATAVFDASTWSELADRNVVRAFLSLLHRRRFFAVPEAERLPALFETSAEGQEELTEALGVQVRRAVELLVEAVGRTDAREQRAGRVGLAQTPAHEVYRGAVTVMMRIVFLLFAEERGLLPADNDLYAEAYSAGRLCAQLEERARAESEEELEHSTAAWHRLLALFTAIHRGVDHPSLRLRAYDGSIFDPGGFEWLYGTADSGPLPIDDRTVLHMLQAVQYVEMGTGRNRERRRLSFRELDVEQIGYVYEGLLSFDVERALGTVVGLVGYPGLEEEVLLEDLERVAGTAGGESFDVDRASAALAEAYKESRIGSAAAIARRLAPLGPAERMEAERKLLAVATPVETARLLPFFGVIRQDLRGLPIVVPPGGLFVTESRLRTITGTHYTPRFLAEQIVEGALEPLVYRPGPLDTADRSAWKPVASEEILRLRVADIAMGSGAFLVAACRYLAGRLLASWGAEGRLPPDAGDAEEEDPAVIEARREVIEHCLYGVDINPMAVEMAKLSLWLISVDPDRPFTFLDDRLVSGDSLLGLTSTEQLEWMHLDPARGRELHEGKLFDSTAGTRTLLADVANLRRRIAEMEDTDLQALAEKRRLLDEARARTAEASRYADLVAGAGLVTAGRGERDGRQAYARAADLAAAAGSDGDDARFAAEDQAREWLRADLPRQSFERQPLHWPLVFPEVTEAGGFDAIVGNPPFLGGKKISGSLGSRYREFVVGEVGRGQPGHADLVAYFVLRAHQLLGRRGQAGLIATNTIAQGDTREVGLDQILQSGVEIRCSVKSAPWPSRSVVLEYAAIWTSRAPLGEAATRTADGVVVAGITSSLDPRGKVEGGPETLADSEGIAFIGSYVLGDGFIMHPTEASRLIEQDSRNEEVLFPFLNGEDLNTRPDCSATRWVINFHDWAQPVAATFPECFGRVERLVKPERDQKNRKAHRLRWWMYADHRPGLYRAIADLDRLIVITLVSKVVMPAMVPARQVFSHALGVFATDDTAMFAILSSAQHYLWAIERSSTLETRVRYTPTDVFETFPRPRLTPELRNLGDRLDSFRRELMLRRQAGLTTTYNLVHSHDCGDDDIVELRRIHAAIDEATVRAYGWDELLAQPGGLDHGHHPTRQGERYTVGPQVRQEILDRLLLLNHERYAAEVAAGLHAKGSGRTSKRRPAGAGAEPEQEAFL